jgi:HK97 family phage prohead protease
MSEDRQRPTSGTVEERTAVVEVADDRRVRGLIPYGVESRDLGGWTEVIEPTAFRNTRLDELRAVIDHQGVPLGRYPRTLEVEDRDDGLHWSLLPPQSRADVVEAIERGDMRAGSWRMVVGREEWRGDTRHIHEIAELRDVTIVGADEPAYGDAATVEYRTHNDGGERRQEGGTMPTEDGAAVEQRENENGSEERTENESTEKRTEDRSEERSQPAGSLRVEDRASAPRRGLAEEFRAAGFPVEAAEIPFDAYEDRAITWSGSVDTISRATSRAAALGADQRYAWPVFPRQNVDSGDTSVDVFTQTARSLATAASVIRAIDAVSAKPETGSTLNIVTTALKQVATIATNIPNVYLEQAAFNQTIEGDLRLALNEGLDKLVIDTFAASGFQAPGTDPLPTSIRKAMTTLFAAGYSPDVVILTPAAAETLDTLVSGISGGTADYVFSPGQFAPDRLYGLTRRVSKTAAAPVVVDSSAYGKLYTSPVRLARFEADSGTTNRGNVRMELNSVFGVERQAAAVRIAAS